jgi:hypothetical protein
MAEIDVLLCYRGRYHNQVERLDAILASRGLRATYDSEILTRETAYEEAQIAWLSLGESGDDKNVAWRGPLSEAVKRSDLVVFLINPRDPSINVMNEIAWAARSGKPLFVVFDSIGGSTSEDYEGFNIGMLQAFYGVSAGNPELLAFGYAFVTHANDDGLDQRLTVLVNRIISYLESVKRGDVQKVRLDNDTTLADVENAPPARACRRLHEAQEKLAKAIGIGTPPNATDMLQRTLALLYSRERDGVVRNGRIYPQNSPFSYPEESERERYRRTEALVNRIRPGPLENPEFLAMLARELVSLEMTQPTLIEPTALVGTVYLCPSNIPVETILEPGFILLLVDATYLDFAYQMLKAAVMSWKITSPPARQPVSMSTKLEDTRATISESPGVVAGFARSLDRMLREGRPGSSTEGVPPAAYHPALSIFGVFEKRFGLAVALARVALLAGTGKERGSGEAKPPTPTEWIALADALAVHWVFDSAQKLDGADATVALQSVLLSLASQELIERSINGFAAPELIPAKERAERISKYFLEYSTRSGMPVEEAENRLRGSQQIAATLDILWQEATASRKLKLARECAARWRWRQGSASATA